MPNKTAPFGSPIIWRIAWSLYAGSFLGKIDATVDGPDLLRRHPTGNQRLFNLPRDRNDSTLLDQADSVCTFAGSISCLTWATIGTGLDVSLAIALTVWGTHQMSFT